MPTQQVLLSICIPAYNRANFLPALLDSVVNQSFRSYEIIICEDRSPERALIAAIAAQYIARYPGLVFHFENRKNLGYDGNIRRLVELASGQFCVFMGNDDLLCPGALQVIADAVAAQSDCGVVVRSYASFEGDPAVHKQVFRYFPEKHVIPAGSPAIETAYRRSVVISGMVLRRDAAHALSTAEFDGTLLYQLYLVGLLAASHSVVFVPEIIALRRDGTPPDFGNSSVEKGKFVPHDQTPESSLHFMEGMLKIARHTEETTGLKVFEGIRRDIGHYSYPIISIQARRPLFQFLGYGISLAKMGFGRYPLFHAYFLALLLLGPSRTDTLINVIKQRLGYTPRFGAAKGGR